MTDLKQQLKDAQVELERVRDEYQEFAYIVSHDLFGALRQVEGFAKIVSAKNADGLDEKTHRHLGLILEGSEKGKKILEALLDFSRLNTTDAPFTSVDCNAVAEDVLSELADLAQAKEAQITCGKLPVIIAYKPMITRVFYNLILNALTYHPANDPPQISITSTSETDHWSFLIQDSGIGMKEANKDKIFKPLRRGVGKGFGDGMGMGLATAKKILERHGGHISVESELSMGAAFTFTVSKDLEID